MAEWEPTDPIAGPRTAVAEKPWEPSDPIIGEPARMPRPTPEEAGKRAEEIFKTAAEQRIPLKMAAAAVAQKDAVAKAKTSGRQPYVPEETLAWQASLAEGVRPDARAMVQSRMRSVRVTGEEGKIGFFEELVGENISEWMPFVPSIKTAIESGAILSAVERLQQSQFYETPSAALREATHPRAPVVPPTITALNLQPTERQAVTPQELRAFDLANVEGFILEVAEIEERGRTIPGHIAVGIRALVPFVAEFLATGGLAKMASAPARQAGIVLLRKYGRSTASRMALRGAKFLAETASGAAIRTMALPRAYAQAIERTLPSRMEFTDAGMLLVQEAGESPGKAFMHAYADTFIEMFSEEMGAGLKGGGTQILRKFPRARAVFQKAFAGLKKIPGSQAVNTIGTRFGYHGFIEEIGEERIGDLLRATFDISPPGPESTADERAAFFSRLVQSIPDGEALLVEAGVLSVPGIVRAGLGAAVGGRRDGAAAVAEAPVAPAAPAPVAAPEMAEAGKGAPEGLEAKAEQPPGPAAEAVAPEAAAPEIVGPGAAQGPPVAPGGAVTSIKAAAMEAGREARGAEPLTAPTPQTRQQWLDEAKARVEADPELPERLVTKLHTDPLNLSPVEVAVLQNHRRGLQNAYDKATDALFEAAKTGDEVARAEAQAVVDKYDAQLNRLDVATQVAGTAWGRSGVARQIELAQDYSLAGMVRRRQAAKGGKALTATELANIKSEHERLAKIEVELAAREQAVTAREQAAEEARAKEHFEKKAPAAPRTTRLAPTSPKFGQANRVFTRAKHDAALARLKGKTGRLAAGLDVSAIADMAEVGGFYFEGGIRAFAAWTEQMNKTLGELAAAAQSHYDAIWKQIQAKRQESAQARIVAKHKVQVAAEQAGAEPKRLAGLEGPVRELFTAFTAQGFPRDAAVDAVHDVLQTVDPSITRRETMDAISGYGKWRGLDKDELKAEVRRRKGELQELAKLADMAAGRAPAKTGFERQAPSDARRALIKKVNEAKRRGGYDIPDPETQLKSALQSLRTRWENEIADLNAKIKAGDFAKPGKRAPIELDEEMAKLKFQRDKIKKAFNEGNFRLRMKQRTVLQKVVGIGQEILNLPRAIKSSLDLSALLRQNLVASIAHPIRTLKKTVPAMLRGLTKAGEHKVDQEILSRPNYAYYMRDGLSLTEHGRELGKMEEAYMSRYAEKIPAVAASQRAFTTALNRSRADSYDALAAALANGRALTPAEGKVIANYVNVITGRGGGGKYASALTGLNSIFFAPRNLIGRFELLLGQPMWHGVLSGKAPLRETIKVRLLIAKEYGRFLTGMAVVFALASAAGLGIGYDPRKSTFGKIRVGKSWLDPLGGLSQVTVFLSRLVTGEKVTVTGKAIPLCGETVYGAGDMADVMWDFLRSKFSPVIGAGVNVLSGRNLVGEPVTPASASADLFMPLAIQDIYESMKENDVPEATILSILSFFGASLQTYEEKGEPPARVKGK